MLVTGNSADLISKTNVAQTITGTNLKIVPQMLCLWHDLSGYQTRGRAFLVVKLPSIREPDDPHSLSFLPEARLKCTNPHQISIGVICFQLSLV